MEQLILESYNSFTDRAGYVYALYCEEAKAIKFGITSSTVEKRVAELQTGNPYLIQPLALNLCEFTFELEKAIHRLFVTQSIRGEWFNLTRPVQLFVWLNFGKILNPYAFDSKVLEFDPKTIRGKGVNEMYGDIIQLFQTPYKDPLNELNIKPLRESVLGSIEREIEIGGQ